MRWAGLDGQHARRGFVGVNCVTKNQLAPGTQEFGTLCRAEGGLRRIDCRASICYGPGLAAFSAKVDAGLAKKMRPNHSRTEPLARNTP